MRDEKLALQDNIHLLHQAADLIRKMDAAVFTHTVPPLYNSGVGSHLRHCTDHYACLLRDLPDRRIDYDQRDRDPRLETDPAYAADNLAALADDLGNLQAGELECEVSCKMDCGSEEENPWAASCVKRELQFLISHTVHHFALIAMILRHQGKEVPENFGVAPSTIKYQQSRLSCAP